MQYLEDNVERFYRALQRTPRIHLWEENPINPDVEDVITLVFDDGKQEKLTCAGRGPIDPIINSRPKYFAEPTTEQIASIIAKTGKEPVTVKYMCNDTRKGKQKNLPVIEFAYEVVSSILNGREYDLSDIGYRIAEGTGKIRGANEYYGFLEIDIKYILDKIVYELYSQGMTRETLYELYGQKRDNDKKIEKIIEETARELGALASIRLDSAFELYEQGLNDKSDVVRTAAAKTLDVLADVRPDEAFRLCKERLVGTNGFVREAAAGALNVLGIIKPEETIELYEIGLNDNYKGVRIKTLEALESLAVSRPNLAFQLCSTKLNDPNSDVRKTASKILNNLKDKSTTRKSNEQEYSIFKFDKILPDVLDEKYTFVRDYLTFLEKKEEEGEFSSEEEVLNKLMNLIQTHEIDYNKLREILEAGYANDMDEMVEFASMNIPNYLVLGKLGRGAIKTAFLVKNIHSEDESVLLQINPNSKGYKHYKQMYKNKGKTDKEIENMIMQTEFSAVKLSNLTDSRFIANVSDPIRCELNGNKYFFMKCQRYEKTLEDKLQESEKINPEKAITYFYQMCIALTNCHNESIVHKDLKPDNIGISDKGNILLSDFGCTSIFSEDANSRYQCPLDLRPPELAYSHADLEKQGKEIISDLFTPATNAWSVGAIFYRMLTGENLFERPKQRAEIGTFEYHRQNEKVYQLIRNFDENSRKKIMGRIKKEYGKIFQELLGYCLQITQDDRENALQNCIQICEKNNIVKQFNETSKNAYL